MDLDDPGIRERWREHLARLFTGRKVISGVMPLAAMNDLVADLARSGAQKPLLVHADRAAGPLHLSRPDRRPSGRGGTPAVVGGAGGQDPRRRGLGRRRLPAQ